MTTPKQKVLDSFHTEFMDKSPLNASLENLFLLKSIGDFEVELYELDYDETNEIFNKDLKRYEISTLGALMYKHYVSREKDRILKLNNVVGKDIKITSMGDSKRTAIKNYEMAKDESYNMMEKLKGGSYQ